MLTSFFGKSKPVNGLSVLIFMTIFFFIANFNDWFHNTSFLKILEKNGILLCFLATVFILNFVAKKNELTKRSAYKILLFAVFSTSFFELLQNNQVIVANLCILLALRRIISMRTQKVIQQKILDATFWICIASLFYFWAILFIIIVFAGILVYDPKPKNWLVPSVGVLAVAMLTTSFHIIVNDSFYTLQEWYQPSSFNFQNYQSLELLIPISIILALTVWTSLFYLGVIQKASVNLRPSYNLILLSLIIATLVAIMAPAKDGSELIFFFIPLSVVASRYFDSDRDKIFREVILAILILMPICVAFIGA